MTTGGAQIGLLDQARCFQARGCRAVVAFLYDKDGLHQAWQESAQFPIYNLHAYKPGASILQNAVLLLKGLFALSHLIRRERFDVVETFTPDSNLVGLPIAWLAAIPVRIATHRGKIENFPRWRRIFHAWVVNSGITDVLVAVSEGARLQAHLEGVRLGKILVIMNGVTPLDVESVNASEVHRTLKLRKGDLFLLAVGRLAYQKGFEILIDAVPALIRKHPNLTVNICGEGPLLADLQSQISNLGLADHVKLLGVWSSMAPLLAIADIFILSSRFEGLSRAMLEAMAAGIPVVATRVEGVEEVVIDGIHGLLVPSEDHDALTSALIQLVDNPQLRKQMGAAAQDHIMASYTTDIMFDKYFDLMANLLNNKKNRKASDA
jgi:glycosyltransferase involved in cell wall biosynthesis